MFPFPSFKLPATSASLLWSNGPDKGLVVVTLSQLYSHFLSLVHWVSPTSVPPILQPSQKISQLYSVTRSSAYSPLITILQASPGIQDGNHLIHSSRPVKNPFCYMTRGSPSSVDPEVPLPTKAPQQKTANPPALRVLFHSELGMVVYCSKTTLPGSLVGSGSHGHPCKVPLLTFLCGHDGHLHMWVTRCPLARGQLLCASCLSAAVLK